METKKNKTKTTTKANKKNPNNIQTKPNQDKAIPPKTVN